MRVTPRMQAAIQVELKRLQAHLTAGRPDRLDWARRILDRADQGERINHNTYRTALQALKLEI